MSVDRRDPSQRAAAQVSRPNLRRLETVLSNGRGRRTPGDGVAFREACGELSTWLVAGRLARGLSREQVAQTTRIQLRTIERLEEGRFDELPADVFVRGFIRGYARCVGLSEDEALARYGSCGFTAAPVASAQAQALLDSMSTLAPETGRAVSEPSPLARPPRALGAPGPARTPAASTPIRAMIDVDAALARGGLEVPLADGSLRDLPAVDVTVTIDDEAADASAAAAADDAATPTEVIAATVATAAGEPEGATRKRRRKGDKPAPRLTGPMERDARGRFVRRTGAMPAVDVAALGLSDEAAAIEGAPAASTEADASAAAPVVADEPATAVRASEPAADEQAAPAAPAAIEPELASAIAAAPIEVIIDVEPSASGRFDRAGDRPVGRTTGSNLAIPPRTSGIHVAPTLVIDDDDPEDAERAREERQAARDDAAKGWRSFIPPALLDQQRGRQGGLTLAVIILLIVATLTLSYLMRRPSSSGDGITAAPSTPDLLA